MKRIALVASALCFALGASSSFAQDKMDKMERTHPAPKKDGMRHDKMDKMEKMEKPGRMQPH